MKKILLIGMVLMLGVSSAGFSARHNNKIPDRGYNNKSYRDDRYKNNKYANNNEKRYNQIYARYSGKLNTLETNLRNKDYEIKKAKAQKRVDWRRVERLNSERKAIKKDLDSTYAQLRKELDRNNLSVYSHKR